MNRLVVEGFGSKSTMRAFYKNRNTRYNARTAFMKVNCYNLQNVDRFWSELSDEDKSKWKLVAEEICIIFAQ